MPEETRFWYLNGTMGYVEQFGRFYRRWVHVQSIVFLGVLILATPFFALSPAVAAGFLAVWGGTMMALLFYMGTRREPDRGGRVAVNILTSIRSLAGVGVLVLVAAHGGRHGVSDSLGIGPFLFAPSSAWIVLILLSLAELTDFLDGRLARKLSRRAPYRSTGSTGRPVFGGIWDMENDSFFALALSFTAWQLAGIPVPVLLIGAMRYFYFLLVRAEGDPPGDNPGFKLFAKSTAATLTIALIVIYIPSLPHAVRGTFVYGALGLQTISFSWDLLLRVKAGTIAIPPAITFFGRRRS